jgi:hypothetical protein
MDTLSYARMVLWSFFGIRRRAAAGEEFARVKPFALAVVAIVLVALFGLTLRGLAELAVQSLGTGH